MVLPPCVGTSWAATEDLVAAYDVMDTRFRVRVRRLKDRDAAVAKRRPVRVVVHNVVQDLHVVSAIRRDAPAKFVVDRVVLDCDVVGHRRRSVPG
jgi:hypothetical protein